MTVLVALLAAVVALLVVLVAGLLRGQTQILLALEELRARLGSGPGTVAASAPGRRAVDVVGLTPTGDPIAIRVGGEPDPTLLVFLSSACTMCAGFWEAFGRRLRLPGRTQLVVVTKGADAEQPERIAALAPPGVAVVMSTEAWAAYGVEFAPHFVLVDGTAGAVVAQGFASTWREVVEALGAAR
ncbi:MAG: hypothetical protein MUP67_00885 [Acidimicrobiia bacterium]|nr:hypothetical protein [Acidimicrobiia bacterium]